MDDKKHRVDVMICSCRRPTEIAILLQSLRTQTFQDFDVFIVDDRSETPYTNYHFIITLINRMRLEGHRVMVWRNDVRYGVTKLRQKTVDRILEIGRGDSILRLDDDEILEPDYIERLVKCLDMGYDIASGLVPNTGNSFIKRHTRFVKPFMCDVKLDKEGNVAKLEDEAGFEYIEKEVIPSVNFRSMALIKKEVHKKVKYEDNLGFSSWREEQFFSFRAILAGFKICVDTGAIGYHTRTPSGGEKTQEFYAGFQQNDYLLNEMCKKYYKKRGDFLEDYRQRIYKEIKEGKLGGVVE